MNNFNPYNANNDAAPLSPANQLGEMAFPIGQDEGANQQLFGSNGFNGAQLSFIQQMEMLRNLTSPNQQQTEHVGSATFAQNIFYNTGNFAPLSPANQLMGTGFSIGGDQGGYQQIPAGISGTPMYPLLAAQQLPVLMDSSPNLNDDGLQDAIHVSETKVPPRRGRPRRKTAEDTPAAKKRKVSLQEPQEEEFSFVALAERFDEEMKKKNLGYENRIGKLEDDLENSILANKYYLTKSHEDDLKIKKLENSNGKLADVMKDFGVNVTSMMDTMEQNWSNKMTALVKKTEAVEEKLSEKIKILAGGYKEAISIQKKAHEAQRSEDEKRTTTALNLKQEMIVTLQGDLQNTVRGKEESDKEWNFALEAQNWITEEKEEEWALRNQCVETEKYELKVTNANLTEEIGKVEKKADFYQDHYKTAMEKVANYGRMMATDFGAPATFEESQGNPKPSKVSKKKMSRK